MTRSRTLQRVLVTTWALCLAACAGTGSGTDAGLDDAAEDTPAPSWAATVTLPTYPFAETTTLEIDGAHLDARAALACSATDGAIAAPDFLLGVLPLEAADDLCEAPRAAAVVRLGDLYLSGYFGGVWLRDGLGGGLSHPGGDGTDEPSDPLQMFTMLVDGATYHLDLSYDAADDKVVSTANDAIGALLMLYGYNRGYLEVVLERPPAGTTAPPDALVCASFLDCALPGVTLPVLERFRPALASLAAPQGERWQKLAAKAEGVADVAVARGRSTWEDILDDASFTAADYPRLVALSAGYLAISQAAVLSAMTAYADQDAPAGRCSRRLQAGLTVWSESYFLGLSSDAAPGTFPDLACSVAE